LKKTATVAVLLASCVSAARAQGPRVHPVPATGELIRVTPGSGAPFTGRLAALGGDTLLLSSGGGDAPLVAVASRDRVEVRRSHREAWSGRGALAGVALGVVASLFQSSGSAAKGNTQKAEVAVVGGAAGAVVGGALGFALAPRRWQPLRAVQPRPSRDLPSPAPADTSPAAPLSPLSPPADTTAVPTPPAPDSSTAQPPAPEPVAADTAAAPVTVPPPAPTSAPPPAAPAPPPRRG
jgi:hypothetical protein